MLLAIMLVLAVVLLSGCAEPANDTDGIQDLEPTDFPDNTTNEPVIFEIIEPLLPATVGQEYSYSFCKPVLDNTSDLCGGIDAATNPTGGQPPYHFQLDSGSGFPPMGVSLNLNGMLTGTPTAAGDSYFTVCAVDLSGNQDCKEFSLTVEEAEVRETWEGTVTTSGRRLCRDGAGNLEPGALSGSGSFAFTIPYSLVKALNNELEEGATEIGELRYGTLDFTETVASQAPDPKCQLYGDSVSGAQFVVYVGLGSEVADEMYQKESYQSIKDKTIITFGNNYDNQTVLMPGKWVWGGTPYTDGGQVIAIHLIPTSISDNQISGTVDFISPTGAGAFTMTKKA